MISSVVKIKTRLLAIYPEGTHFSHIGAWIGPSSVAPASKKRQKGKAHTFCNLTPYRCILYVAEFFLLAEG